jgi:hypothetical protein
VKQETKDPTTGTVTSRQCPLCGHHEIGFMTQDGEFHSLKAGTRIRVFEAPSSSGPTRDTLETPFHTEAADQPQYRLWMPEPLRGDRALRLKYSVMVKDHLFKGEMSRGLYGLAFVEKLEKLIERELDIPLPVILDRFFNAPYLASGNPRQIAEAMYRELDEIQRPAVLVGNWLERGGDQSLAELIAPKSTKELGHDPAEDAQVEKELEKLGLEEFLEML